MSSSSTNTQVDRLDSVSKQKSAANLPRGSALPPAVLHNYQSRVTTDLARMFGTSGQMVFDGIEAKKNPQDPSVINQDLEEGVIIGYGTGLILGWIIHKLSMRFNWYTSNGKSLNPLHRNVKTLMNIGLAVGAVVTSLLPLPNKGKQFLSVVIANSFCAVFGIFAFPYWLYRAKYKKIDPVANREKTNWITGDEGWSKFGKTIFVGSNSLGQLGSAFYTHFVRAPLATTALLIGQGTSLLSTFIGIITVPLINRFFGKALKSDKGNKDAFRNNYIRTFMALMTGLGGVAAFFTGGLAALIIIPIANIFGGILGGVLGKKISTYTKEKWKLDSDTENAWDYSTRTTSSYFGAIGGAIGAVIPLPGAILLGTAIGTTFGWVLGLPLIRAARKIDATEVKSSTLSWTQRVGDGANRGALIGGIVGFIMGIAGGPLGIMAGIALCSGIGSAVYGLVAGLQGKESRTVIKKFFSRQPEATVESRDMAPPEKTISPAPALNPIAPVVEPTQTSTATALKVFTSQNAPEIKPEIPIIKKRVTQEECISNDDDMRESFAHARKIGLHSRKKAFASPQPRNASRMAAEKPPKILPKKCRGR